MLISLVSPAALQFSTLKKLQTGNCHILKAMTTGFALQDRDTNRQQSPCGDSMVGVGDGGKEVEGCVDQLMGLGECETVHSSSAFEQWDSYWEDLTRYWFIIHLCT